MFGGLALSGCPRTGVESASPSLFHHGAKGRLAMTSPLLLRLPGPAGESRFGGHRQLSGDSVVIIVGDYSCVTKNLRGS